MAVISARFECLIALGTLVEMRICDSYSPSSVDDSVSPVLDLRAYGTFRFLRDFVEGESIEAVFDASSVDVDVAVIAEGRTLLLEFDSGLFLGTGGEPLPGMLLMEMSEDDIFFFML